MSPGAVFSTLLERYGQRVEVCPPGEALGIPCRAFMQPLPLREEQELPTPLGRVRQDRWRYLGSPAVSPEGGYVRWQGEEYEVIAAQPVYLGEQMNHWRAVLRRRDREVAEP